MIKKLFLCAALVGAVGLTSCVDDVESTSAQAVRQAKAEQLRAAGDLEKANAQAALVLANAEQQAAQTAAAAKQAQAELDKANAAYQNALAAYQQAEANAVKAQSDIEKQEAEVALQQAQVELEQQQVALEQANITLQAKQQELLKLIAQYEYQIAQYQYDAENYKQQLQNSIAQADVEEFEKLSSLVITYNSAYTTLTTLQKSLIEQNFNLAQYEAGLFGDAKAAQNLIDNANKSIKALNKNISDAKAAIEALQTSDVQTAVQKFDALQAEASSLNQAQKTAYNEYQEANYANIDAQAALNNSDYMTAIDALKNSNYYGFSVIDANGGSVPADMNGYWYVRYTVPAASGQNSVTKYIPLFTTGETNSTAYTENYVYNTSSYSVTYYYTEYSSPYYEADQDGCEEFAKLLDEYVAENQQKDATQAADSLNTLTKLQDNLIAAEDAYAVAKKNNTGLDQIKPALTDAQITERQSAQKKAAETMLKAMNAVNKAYNNAYGTSFDDNLKIADVSYDSYFNNEIDNKIVLRRIDNLVLAQTRNKNNYDSYLASAQTIIDGVKANLNTISTGSADYAKLVETAGEASKAYAVAYCDWQVASGKYQTNQTLMDAYNVVVNADGNTASDVTDMIKHYNEDIAQYEAQIEDYNELISVYEKRLEAGNLDNAEIIAQTKAEIEKLEAQIAAQQKVVDAAKANLDAALSAE